MSACGSAVRQDGRSASLTAPSGLAQQGLLRASLSDGGVQARSLACAEAHGTGTALGDPIEAGSLAAAALVPLGGSGAGCVSLGSGKANVGHAEPAAGASGLLRLVLELEASSGAPNAQLSVLNPHVGSALFGLSVSLSQQLGPLQTACAPIGGVGSFGYSGTIVHAVLQVACLSPAERAPVRASRRQVFRWCSVSHPFLQSLAPSTSSGLVFSTPLTGALRPLVVDHVVQGRVVFPGAGYLEVGRALHASDAGSLAPVMMHGVFFLQPLAMEAADTRLECSLVGEQFEVRSSAAGDAADVHCSSSVRPGKAIGHASHAHARRQHAKGASIAATYQSLHSSGLEYGPGYRALVQAWNGSDSSATARLRQQMHTGGAVVVHPADVDGSLQLTRLAEGTRMQQTAETRLPFAVDGARLSVGSSRLWAVANRHGEESASVRLGTQAQLDGFKSRKVGQVSATRRDLYATHWCSLTSSSSSNGSVTILGSTSTHAPISAQQTTASLSTILAFLINPDGGICHFEALLSLLQVQAIFFSPCAAIIVTQVTTPFASVGQGGLARTARVEALLSVNCLSAHTIQLHDEPEVVVRCGLVSAPRLGPFSDLSGLPEGHLSSCQIVTGGTAGLGLLTGRWLAQRGVSTVALASRSGTASAKSAEWLQLQESSCTVLTLQADVADTSHVQRLMATTQPFSLNGIWHAAGVLADGVLPKQSAEGLARVYAPKAHSMWKLQRASAFTPLAACTLFSSVVALLGGAGQANYAAANACLDAIAGLRRTRAQPAASMQWGAWAEIGMAARGAANERVAAMEAASGFGRVGLAQGLAALQTSVCDGTPAVLSVLPIVWSRMLSGMADVPALLSSFAPRRRRSRECMGEGHDEPVAVGAVSLEAVMGLVHRTAGGSADADVPLMEAGLDSLGAVELRNQLQQAAGEGMALPSTLVFDHPTARQLFTLVESRRTPACQHYPNASVPTPQECCRLRGGRRRSRPSISRHPKRWDAVHGEPHGF